MTPADPAVSIVVRIHNAESYLREALDSAFAQTFGDFELIAILDGSTDGSAAIVAAYDDSRMRVVDQPNAGRAAAAMRGLAEARGTYVAILDADDRWDREHLSLLVRELERDPRLALVGSATRIIDAEGATIGSRTYPMHDRDVRKNALLFNPFAHSAVVFRTALARRAGGYVAELAHEDYGLWLRLLRLGTGANLAAPLCDYRVSAAATADRIRYMLRGTIEVRRVAFADFGYERTAATRAIDLALSLLDRLPMRLVERVFRALFYRAKA